MSVLHLWTTRIVVALTVAFLLVQFYVINPSLLVHNQRPPQLIDCSEPLILLDDGGRMGNQFFEYLEAKLLGEQLNRTVFIRQALSEKFKKYFTGIDNPVFGSFDQVDQLCNNNNRVKIHMTGLVKIDPTKATKPHVKLTSTIMQSSSVFFFYHLNIKLGPALMKLLSYSRISGLYSTKIVENFVFAPRRAAQGLPMAS